MGVFNCSKACLQYSRIIFQSALIFKVLQDALERLEAWRCFYACGYRYRSNRLIHLYQVGVFQCQQPCLEYFKIIDYIITIYTRQSKKINFFYCIQINIRSSNKLYLVFSIVCFRHTQSSLSCRFIVFEAYLNFFVALLVEIAKSCVSGVATRNILYPCFVNWGTTGSCLIFTFYLSFWGLTSFCG